jgi:hypothetical protein
MRPDPPDWFRRFEAPILSSSGLWVPRSEHAPPPPQIPWYESNLLWAPVAIAIGIAIAVIAAMNKDVRWLLWLSDALFLFGAWAGLRAMSPALRRRLWFCGTSLTILVATSILYRTLKPAKAESTSVSPTPRYFPWMFLNETLIGRKSAVVGFVVSFMVRDRSDSLGLPNNPLDNVRFLVNIPIPRSDTTGWHQCEIIRSPILPEWSNRDSPPPGAFGYFKLNGDNTLIYATVSASSGTWDYKLLLRLIDGALEYREVLSGQFFSDGYTLTMDRHSKGLPITDQTGSLTPNDGLFSHYSLQFVKGEQVNTACAEIKSRFSPYAWQIPK